jgi:hypothetical protein
VTILSLIQKIMGYHCSLFELKLYLKLLNHNDFPVAILDVLTNITKRKLLPSYYVDFSKQ